MPPVLFHAKVGGKVMPLVADGDKAGNFWLLNSRTGRLVNHVAVTFQYNQHSEPSRQGTVACPKHGIEFNGGSFDPKTDMFYVPSNSQCGLWKSTKSATYIPGQFYLGGFFPQLIGAAWGDLSAIDLDSGVFAWRHHDNLPMAGGVVSTASGLVFTGELDGDFDAFDATTGKELWKYQTGSPIIAPPVVFTTDGREYVAVASGPAGTEQLPILPKPDGTKLTMFAISR
jgi:alcohol dehydrogenase (cytochrome c)